MFCKECGAELGNTKSSICVQCGVKRGKGENYCDKCGDPKKNPNQDICLNCGNELKNVSTEKTKMVALLLALFIGGFGAHLFYVGKNARAILYIALTLGGILTCGITSVVALVLELIDVVFICMDKFTDAEGNILTEWT